MAVVCTGFVATAHMIAKMYGLQTIRILEYPPPNISTQKPEEVRKHAVSLLDALIGLLTKASYLPENAARPTVTEVNPRECVFRGTLKEINEFFYRRQWTDGLPIVPPTLDAVDEMLKYTERSPSEVLGLLKPAHRQASVWSLAVNGVMAGCRPEYMPVLVSLIEAIVEPRFGLHHAGSTSGWTPFIILNGPIIKDLGFNAGQGVLRPERMANITVARFLKLVMSNIAGFRLGTTDMSSFGNNYIPVLAEAEDDSPFEPLSVEQGFNKGSNVVTILSADSLSMQFGSAGDAEEHLQTLAKEMTRYLSSGYIVITTFFGPEVLPVLCLSPLVASILAKASYTKNDIKKYIYDNARIPAIIFERELKNGIKTGYTIHQAIEEGKLPPSYCETDDPNRMLPLLRSPEQLMIVVSGPTARNRNFIVLQVGNQGLTVSKEIKLPTNWKQLREKVR